MKSGDETLEGLSEKQNSNEKVETSTRGKREQKIIVVLGKPVFLIPEWEEAEKGEKTNAQRLSPSTPSPQLLLKIHNVPKLLTRIME